MFNSTPHNGSSRTRPRRPPGSGEGAEAQDEVGTRSTTPSPGIVTAVEGQTRVRKHLGERVNVFVAGRFSFALARETAAAFGVRAGLELSQVQLEAVLAADGASLAYVKALNFMSYRPRSRAEVATRLRSEGCAEPAVEAVLARLETEGALNDARFAAEWVAGRTLSRPRGQRRLQQELRQRGVERELIDAALPEPDAELENAKVALRPQLRRWANLEPRARQEKALAWAQRRGFGFATARSALASLDAEEAEDAESD